MGVRRRLGGGGCWLQCKPPRGPERDSFGSRSSLRTDCLELPRTRGRIQNTSYRTPRCHAVGQRCASISVCDHYTPSSPSTTSFECYQYAYSVFPLFLLLLFLTLFSLSLSFLPPVNIQSRVYEGRKKKDFEDVMTRHRIRNMVSTPRSGYQACKSRTAWGDGSLIGPPPPSTAHQ